MNCSTHKPNNKLPKLLNLDEYWTIAPKKNVPNVSKLNASGNGISPSSNKRQQTPPSTLPGASAIWNTSKQKVAESKPAWQRRRKAHSLF